MPKLAVAVFACFTLFAVVFVINRAPAIYDNEMVFENKALFHSVDASQLPAPMSVGERSVDGQIPLEDMMEENRDEDVLQALVEGRILEKEIFLYNDGEEWGLCVYKISLSEVLDVVNTPDFLSRSEDISVVAYAEDISELASLPNVGDKVRMLLCKTEDGSAISELGKRCGISGAWELYGSVNVENSK